MNNGIIISENVCDFKRSSLRRLPVRTVRSAGTIHVKEVSLGRSVVFYFYQCISGPGAAWPSLVQACGALLS